MRDIGRHSTTRTVSPSWASLRSSWACSLIVRAQDLVVAPVAPDDVDPHGDRLVAPWRRRRRPGAPSGGRGRAPARGRPRAPGRSAARAGAALLELGAVARGAAWRPAARRARRSSSRSSGVTGARAAARRAGAARLEALAAGLGPARPRAPPRGGGASPALVVAARPRVGASSASSAIGRLGVFFSHCSVSASGRHGRVDARAGARRSARARGRAWRSRRPAVFSSSPVACCMRRPNRSRRAVAMCSRSASSSRSRSSRALHQRAPGPRAGRTWSSRAACGRPGASPRGRAARARRPARTSRGRA